MKTALILALSFVGSIAFANHGEEHDGKNHPCKKIHDACEAAGFKKGGHKDGKGMHKDCMMKLAAGETVPGVTVDAADVASCKAKWADHKGGKPMHGKNDSKGGPAPASTEPMTPPADH